MKIAHITSELCPVAKVGGLADVTLGLGRETQKQGHHTFLILPKYSCLNYDQIHDLKSLNPPLEITYDQTIYRSNIYVGHVYDLTVYFIESPKELPFFQRDKIYGYRDDLLRFGFFALAALHFLAREHQDTEIIHLHEWQAAIAAPLLETSFKSHLSAKTIFTLHNLNYQGISTWPLFKKLGLEKIPPKLQQLYTDPKRSDRLNLTKGTLYLADAITTVSPKYAEEILQPKQSRGLQIDLENNLSKLTGILNGIDYDTWNPSNDPLLKHSFSFEDLAGKQTLKKELRSQLNLPQSSNAPLVTTICRLVPQKGLRLIKKAIYTTLDNGGQFILFGSSPIEKIQNEFDELKKQLSNNPNVIFIFDSYNEPLAHLIYAGADLIVCPSLFEPCGLTQLIAMRYGTLPLVRKTGGLADTVFDSKEVSQALGANGFSFIPATSRAIEQTLKKALKMYRDRPNDWDQLVQNAMHSDWSWKKPTLEYLRVYQKALSDKSKKRIA